MNQACENCGGTDFYKESGFYYCTECQIQSQHVQEHVYREDEVDFDNLKTKKQSKATTNQDTVTKWECYNYTLLGLTNELINLGAKPELKKVVKIIWLKYLEVLEVIQRGNNVKPKLQAIGSKQDAKVLLGRTRKRRRSKSSRSSGSVDSTILDIRAKRREKSKKRRELIDAYSQEASQRAAAQTDTDSSLSDLKSEASTSKSSTSILTLNKYARQALRKALKPSEYHHLGKHLESFERTKASSSQLIKYRKNSFYLSPKKLYMILYCGLLIVKDNINLGDFLMFIDQGHLTLNNYNRFYPDEFQNKKINNLQPINTKFSFESMHSDSMSLAKKMHLNVYFKCPNLIELTERYCNELNLPKQFCKCVQVLISRLKIFVNFRESNILATNYTGRVLSVILVALKILFSLDDKTEYHHAKLAEILNKSERTQPKMFDCIAWLKHLQYRQIVMRQHHFPSVSIDNAMHNLEGYYDAMKTKEFSNENNKTAKTKNDLMFLLNKLNDFEGLDGQSKLNFPVSLTPYRDFSKYLCDNAHFRQNPYLFDVLKADFNENSIDFALKPYKFIRAANNGQIPPIVHGTAYGNNLKCEKLRNLGSEMDNRRDKQIIAEALNTPIGSTESKSGDNCYLNVDFREFDRTNMARFFRNLNKTISHSENIKLKLNKLKKDLKNEDKYKTHYFSCEKYWMRFMTSPVSNGQEWERFLLEFPDNFKIVFHEAMRISKQTVNVLMPQFIFTEMYLIYSTEKFANNENDQFVKKYLQNKMHLW